MSFTQFEMYIHSLQVFGGNRDGDTVVKNHMIKPVIARLVRIRPLEWNTGGSICMRVELYGCVRTYGRSISAYMGLTCFIILKDVIYVS